MELVDKNGRFLKGISTGDKICCWCGMGIDWTLAEGPRRGVAFRGGDSAHQNCAEEMDAQADEAARALARAGERELQALLNRID